MGKTARSIILRMPPHHASLLQTKRRANGASAGLFPRAATKPSESLSVAPTDDPTVIAH